MTSAKLISVSNLPLSISIVDLIALSWFIFCWYGYNIINDNLVKSTRSLRARMHLYRIQWMATSLKRDNRVVDINILANLQTSVSFLASTSLLVIAGLLAALISSEQALEVVNNLPFSCAVDQHTWNLKVFVLIFLFVYAFFKFTWSLRQLNYSSILLGALPITADPIEQFLPSARRAAIISTLAAKHMNRGLRSFYFAIAVLAWFIDPWLFIAATGWVVIIMYRREYRSEVVKVLNMPSENVLSGKES
jgi:uncharacterized membrane protein